MLTTYRLHVASFCLSETHRWDRPVSTVSIRGHPSTMAFNSYRKPILIANEDFFWHDWNTRKRRNYFCIGNPKGNTSITALDIINQHVGGIIMVVSGVPPLYALFIHMCELSLNRWHRPFAPQFTLEQGPLQFNWSVEVALLRCGFTNRN